MHNPPSPAGSTGHTAAGHARGDPETMCGTPLRQDRLSGRGRVRLVEGRVRGGFGAGSGAACGSGRGPGPCAWARAGRACRPTCSLGGAGGARERAADRCRGHPRRRSSIPRDAGHGCGSRKFRSRRRQIPAVLRPEGGGDRVVPLDVRSQRVKATVERLVKVGATVLRVKDDPDTGLPVAAVQDPEGNEFGIVRGAREGAGQSHSLRAATSTVACFVAADEFFVSGVATLRWHGRRLSPHSTACRCSQAARSRSLPRSLARPLPRSLARSLPRSRAKTAGTRSPASADSPHASSPSARDPDDTGPRA
ncbi:VOC family protein [Streptomyces sp. CA-253872]|uniref:VOC family protein n=1 Tax=Streptomyces sp. CA-253872 TaxID=3240067 RepID=UPI003D91C068